MGLVDREGRIVHSGYRMVLSFSGPAGWGRVERFHINRNGRCIADILEQTFRPCPKPEPDFFGWALLNSFGSVLRGPYAFGRDSDHPLPNQLPPLSDAGSFSEGLAAGVDFGSLGSDKWGYIDEAGRTIIPGAYDEVGPFSGGLAPCASSQPPLPRGPP